MQNFGLTDPKIRLTRKAALRAPKPKEAQKHVLEQQLSPRVREVESKSMKLHGLQRRLRRTLRGDDLARTDGICRASPEWLVLCINNFCNLHCKMCDVGRGEEGTVFYANLVGSRPQNMSLGLVEKRGEDLSPASQGRARLHGAPHPRPDPRDLRSAKTAGALCEHNDEWLFAAATGRRSRRDRSGLSHRLGGRLTSSLIQA